MLVFCNLLALKITPLVSRLNFTNMILVLYAHPYPQHSRACKALLNAVTDLPGLEVRLHDAIERGFFGTMPLVSGQGCGRGA